MKLAIFYVLCDDESYDFLFSYHVVLGDEQHYAFLIPIMKCLIEKTHGILQMNVQVPNIPLNNISPTFYEDFKEYCKSDEWRIFIQKQVCILYSFKKLPNL
jgi:hypothetical protein